MARSSLSLFERLFSRKKKQLLAQDTPSDNPLTQEPAPDHTAGLRKQAQPQSPAQQLSTSQPIVQPFVEPPEVPSVAFTSTCGLDEATSGLDGESAASQEEASAAAVAVVTLPADIPGQSMAPTAMDEAPMTEEIPGITEAAIQAFSAAESAVSPDGEMDGAPMGAISVSEDAGDPDAEQHDTALEYDSMVLLSKLEQLVIRLSDSSVQKSMPLVVDALVELMNHLIEFAEQLPVVEAQKLSLPALLERDAQNYAQLQPHHIQNDRLTLGEEADRFRQEPEAFQQLRNDILRMVNIYLSASVKAFRSPRIGEQWKTLYTGFFVNLSKVVRSSQDKQQS